ncbi:hypothetical protein [Peribacillus simplex]|uniref:hypothetical protein n=1 Tax=Peribacillus simplex TaxID=1478 RepID=UPI0015C2C2CE|nr:hypothetical protein [Peribacillus simplex]
MLTRQSTEGKSSPTIPLFARKGLNMVQPVNPFRQTAEVLPLTCCQQQPPVPCQFDTFKIFNANTFSCIHLYYSSSANI